MIVSRGHYYIGTSNEVSHPIRGDVCVDGISSYSFKYYDGKNWVTTVVGETITNTSNEKFVSSKLPTNCKNCGALLTSHVCEYCGTHY